MKELIITFDLLNATLGEMDMVVETSPTKMIASLGDGVLQFLHLKMTSLNLFLLSLKPKRCSFFKL